VPHLVRPLVGYTPSRTLVPSFLAGACLALGADLVVRLVPSSGEIKIGVITAIIGLPFFLFLLGQARRRSHDDLWGGA
jgi:iron complex transport system permease protein